MLSSQFEGPFPIPNGNVTLRENSAPKKSDGIVISLDIQLGDKLAASLRSPSFTEAEKLIMGGLRRQLERMVREFATRPDLLIQNLRTYASAANCTFVEIRETKTAPVNRESVEPVLRHPFVYGFEQLMQSGKACIGSLQAGNPDANVLLHPLSLPTDSVWHGDFSTDVALSSSTLRHIHKVPFGIIQEVSKVVPFLEQPIRRYRFVLPELGDLEVQHSRFWGSLGSGDELAMNRTDLTLQKLAPACRSLSRFVVMKEFVDEGRIIQISISLIGKRNAFHLSALEARDGRMVCRYFTEVSADQLDSIRLDTPLSQCRDVLRGLKLNADIARFGECRLLPWKDERLLEELAQTLTSVVAARSAGKNREFFIEQFKGAQAVAKASVHPYDQIAISA